MIITFASMNTTMLFFENYLEKMGAMDRGKGENDSYGEREKKK